MNCCFPLTLQEMAVHSTRLQEFYNKASHVISVIKKDTASCKKAYNDCIEFFGESPVNWSKPLKDQVSVDTFFGYFVSFNTAWKVAETENDRRRKQVEAAKDKWKKAMDKDKASVIKTVLDQVRENELQR